MFDVPSWVYKVWNWAEAIYHFGVGLFLLWLLAMFLLVTLGKYEIHFAKRQSNGSQKEEVIPCPNSPTGRSSRSTLTCTETSRSKQRERVSPSTLS